MLDRIDLNLFIISFCIGIMIIYCTKPKPSIVNKFPSPTNKNLIYQDNVNNCYKYVVEETSCDANSIVQPIIED